MKKGYMTQFGRERSITNVSSQERCARCKDSNEQICLPSTYDKIIFPGFLKIYDKVKDPAEDEASASVSEESPLSKLKIQDKLDLVELTATEKYTTPEPRYNDGTLVKKLEELGIGRPSTYANMINGVLDKHLVTRTQIEGEDTEVRTLTKKPKSKIKEGNKT